MTYIHIVRTFYIDNELQLKKIEKFSKRSPHGGLAPILWPIYGKVPERELIFLNDSLKSSMDTSVDKVSPFKSLTRLRDFSKKSREIFETFETFLFWIMRPTT